MNFTKKSLRLYAVTDRSWLHGETLYEQVEKALKGGVTLVQLREKELSEVDFEQEAKELLELCHKYNVNLIINDNVALGALRAFAEKGVKVPEDVSMISCEYFTTSQFYNPPMTVIDRHNNRFGKLVIEKLLSVMKGQEETDVIDIRPDLIIRGSCAAPSK